MMILAAVGIIVATIHYCLVSVELDVVRDDIRRLAEQMSAELDVVRDDIRRLAEQIRASKQRRH